ncbi:MAG: outer membrane protein assembly factor BamA [Acidiferrobacterales bacterium]
MATILILALSVKVAIAAESFIVKDIKVTGLERISIGTVFNYLPIKVGDRVTQEDVSNSIRSLFKTGFFQDVKISARNNVLIVHVVERPSISEVDISGSKKISEDDLRKSVNAAGIAPGRTFNQSLFDKVEQDLKNQYFNLGYYSVRIDSRVESAGGNKVKVIIKIAEGKPARIKDINIIGNKAFPDKRLLSLLRLRTTKKKGLFSKRDQYSQEELRGDIEKLKNFYLDRGYLDYALKSQNVTIGPDKESIFITLVIVEGSQYKVSKVDIKGRLELDRSKIVKLVTIKPGQIFSRKEVASVIDKIVALYGENGYANARVNTIPETDKNKGTVALNFLIDPGKKVYVRRILISGNNVTKDSVIRREMRQLEGSWYSTEKIKISQRHLQRLGYFDDVSIQAVPVAGADDLVDISVKVKERSTGSISLGGGYSNEYGIFVTLAYSERNAFGTGNDISISYDNSQATTVYEFSYTNPYYTVNGVSRSLELHSRTNDATQTQTGGYIMQADGFGVNYGIPISDDRTVGIGAGYEKIGITTTATSGDTVLNYITANGNENYLLRSTLSWSQDTLNDYRFPTSGVYYKVSAESGIPGGDLTYVKASVDSSVYFPLGEKSTLKLRGNVGYATAYGNTTVFPFFKNFYAGGASSVRGFRARSLGPRDTGAGTDPIGGTKLLNANMEYFFPLPGAKDEDSSMRLSLFLDAGMVYAADQPVDASSLRYSAGLAFTWFTPAFPLALSLGYPLNAQSGDETEPFQFSIGIPLR